MSDFTVGWTAKIGDDEVLHGVLTVSKETKLDDIKYLVRGEAFHHVVVTWELGSESQSKDSK